MQRVSVLFAVASTSFLLAGLLLSYRSLVDIHVGRIIIGLGSRECCFIFAALLCAFAAVYSLWMLPLNLSAAYWHLWITAVSVAAFVTFFGIGEYLTGGHSRATWIALTAELLSGVALIAGLAILAVNLAQAVYKLLHSGLALPVS